MLLSSGAQEVLLASKNVARTRWNDRRGLLRPHKHWIGPAPSIQTHAAGGLQLIGERDIFLSFTVVLFSPVYDAAKECWCVLFDERVIVMILVIRHSSTS